MKKQIFKMILWRTIPLIRNIQSNGFKSKIRNLCCRYESELIYKVPNLILSNLFSNSDIDFLNIQAKHYYKNCNREISAEYLSNIELIKELFLLVPLEKKMMLDWEGPIIEFRMLKKELMLQWQPKVKPIHVASIDLCHLNCAMKQKIYLNMLTMNLLHIKEIQSLGIWRRGFDLSCYYDSELIHNLVHSVHEKNFVEHDIHFLNNQCRWY